MEPLAVGTEHQIPYFASEDGLGGFLAHLGDNPWVQTVEVSRDGFNNENPRRPLSLWEGVGEGCKDLICACAMVCYD